MAERRLTTWQKIQIAGEIMAARRRATIEVENDAELYTVGAGPRLGESARSARGIPRARSAGPAICPSGVLAV